MLYDEIRVGVFFKPLFKAWGGQIIQFRKLQKLQKKVVLQNFIYFILFSGPQ